MKIAPLPHDEAYLFKYADEINEKEKIING